MLAQDEKLDKKIIERTTATGRLFVSTKINFLGKLGISKDAGMEVFKLMVLPY